MNLRLFYEPFFDFGFRISDFGFATIYLASRQRGNRKSKI